MAVAVDWVAWRGSEELGGPRAEGWLKLRNADAFATIDWEEGDEPNGYRYYHPEATHYTLGAHAAQRTHLEVWQPFGETAADGAVGANVRGALYSLYWQELDRYFVNLTNAGWEGVAVDAICQPGAPCPNAMIVGTSQLAGRVAADRILTLNRHFEEYLQSNLQRLEDDFPNFALYQYNNDGNWMGIPFITDTRLLGFNRTTLESMQVELPPPHGTRRWGWADLAELACNISKVHAGRAGLVMSSDWDEDFKLFMMMVQSRGAALYTTAGHGAAARRRCDLESAAAAIDDFWRPIFDKKCVAAGDGGTYWSGMSPPDAAFERVLEGPLDPKSPPDTLNLSKYVNGALNGSEETLGFFLSTGIDDSSPVGRCRPLDLAQRNVQLSPGQGCTRVGDVLPANDTGACEARMHDLDGDSFAYQAGHCLVLQCVTEYRLHETLWSQGFKLYDFYSVFCSEIVYAQMPGSYTYMGGAGLVIPKAASDFDLCYQDVVSWLDAASEAECGRKAQGWRIIAELANKNRPWILQANIMKGRKLPPPVDSLANSVPFTKWKWQPAMDALRRAIPSQYPNSPMLHFDELERQKPVRIALVRALYGNESSRQALRGACSLVDELLRPCDAPNWRNDSRCTFPIDGLQGCPSGQFFQPQAFGVLGCELCPLGTYRENRSVLTECSACPGGKFSASWGSSECEDCPAGKASLYVGWTACAKCSVGHVPNRNTGAEKCDPCGEGTYQVGPECVSCPAGFTSPSQSFTPEACQTKHQVVLENLVLVALVTSLFLLMPLLLGRPVPINDIHMEDDCVVVKTWGHHRIFRWSPLPLKAVMQGTGCPSVDGREVPFRVKVRDGDELWLLDESGQHVSQEMNASMGSLRLTRSSALLGAAVWHVPANVVAVALVIATVLLVLALQESGDAEFELVPRTLASLAVSLVVSCGIYFYLWSTSFRATPLYQRRKHFREKLHRSNSKPCACARGPERAVAAGKICELFEYFQDFIRNRDMYYVATNLLLPLTEPEQLSYAELVGPSSVHWFVSHFWGMAFNDFVASLRRLAEDESSLNWQGATFWVCSLSNNQWRVAAELGSGDPLDSSFYLALQSSGCKGTAMVLDQYAEPLTRSWCLFEVFQTFVLTAEREHFEGLLLCTPTGVLQHGDASVDTVLGLAQRLSSISLEDATATRAEDKAMIDACVVAMDGGFPAVNRFVRDCIKAALENVHRSFEGDFASLVQALDEPERMRTMLSADRTPRLLGQMRRIQVPKRQERMSTEGQLSIGSRRSDGTVMAVASLDTDVSL